MKPEDQRDAVVLWVAWALGWLQRLLAIPHDGLKWIAGRLNSCFYRESRAWTAAPTPKTPRAQWWRIVRARHCAWTAAPITKTPTAGLYFSYVYVLAWTAGAVVAYVLAGYAGRGSSWAWLIAAVVLFRCLEILVWYAKMLLDRLHRSFYSPERNLLFLIADGFIAVTATSTLLRLGRGPSPVVSSWIDGLGVLTLNGRPHGYSPGWANGATAVGTLLGLMLIGAGLALLVGIIQPKFRYDTVPYTGRTRLGKPKPRWQPRRERPRSAASEDSPPAA